MALPLDRTEETLRGGQNGPHVGRKEPKVSGQDKTMCTLKADRLVSFFRQSKETFYGFVRVSNETLC